MLKNVTPDHLRCQGGQCPAVYEVTPEDLRCSFGGCPSVHKATDGSLVIIGKKPSAEILAELEGRVGSDEDIIMIDRTYFAGLGGEDGG